jgi:hypothetical protein
MDKSSSDSERGFFAVLLLKRTRRRELGLCQTVFTPAHAHTHPPSFSRYFLTGESVNF